MKKTIEQIRTEIAAYFLVREARAEPLTPLQEEIKSNFADTRYSARSLRSDYKDVVEYVRETFSSREKALFRSMCDSSIANAESDDNNFVKQVLARGQLRSDDEFRELLSIVDSSIQSGDGASELVQRANQILAAWELSTFKTKSTNKGPG